MSKRTIEINDDLEELVNAVETEILEHYIEWLTDSLSDDDTPDEISRLNHDDWYQGHNNVHYGCDKISEAADSNVPIYFSHLNDLWYLYGDIFIQSAKDSGCDIETKDNNKMQQQAIYFYLSEQGHEFAQGLEETLNEHKEEEGITKQKLIEYLHEIKFEGQHHGHTEQSVS